MENEDVINKDFTNNLEGLTEERIVAGKNFAANQLKMKSTSMNNLLSKVSKHMKKAALAVKEMKGAVKEVKSEYIADKMVAEIDDYKMTHVEYRSNKILIDRLYNLAVKIEKNSEVAKEIKQTTKFSPKAIKLKKDMVLSIVANLGNDMLAAELDAIFVGSHYNTAVVTEKKKDAISDILNSGHKIAEQPTTKVEDIKVEPVVEKEPVVEPTVQSVPEEVKAEATQPETAIERANLDDEYVRLQNEVVEFKKLEKLKEEQDKKLALKEEESRIKEAALKLKTEKLEQDKRQQEEEERSLAKIIREQMDMLAVQKKNLADTIQLGDDKLVNLDKKIEEDTSKTVEVDKESTTVNTRIAKLNAIKNGISEFNGLLVNPNTNANAEEKGNTR